MKKDIGTFPFGQPVQQVVQKDRSPKRVFILGVYASAVHARWIGFDGKTKIKAFAVASEPYIFWRGDNADELIEKVDIPKTLGRLVPASKQYNGPSGLALDDLILYPLGLTRSDVWLCDLVPHSCVNPSQNNAIAREYLPLIPDHGLPVPSVPIVPTRFTNENRRNDILDEFLKSGAGTFILLGDKPIQWFLNYFDRRWKRLSDFVQNEESYGQVHSTQIKGKTIDILPLAHPRQIAKLGRYSVKWYEYHQIWIQSSAPKVL